MKKELLLTLALTLAVTSLQAATNENSEGPTGIRLTRDVQGFDERKPKARLAVIQTGDINARSIKVVSLSRPFLGNQYTVTLSMEVPANDGLALRGLGLIERKTGSPQLLPMFGAPNNSNKDKVIEADLPLTFDNGGEASIQVGDQRVVFRLKENNAKAEVLRVEQVWQAIEVRNVGPAEEVKLKPIEKPERPQITPGGSKDF